MSNMAQKDKIGEDLPGSRGKGWRGRRVLHRPPSDSTAPSSKEVRRKARRNPWEAIGGIVEDDGSCFRPRLSAMSLPLVIMVVLAALIGTLTVITWYVTNKSSSDTVGRLAHKYQTELIQRSTDELKNSLDTKVHILRSFISLLDSETLVPWDGITDPKVRALGWAMFNNSPGIMALGVQRMNGSGFFYRREDPTIDKRAVPLPDVNATQKPDHAGADSTPRFYIMNGTTIASPDGLVPAQFSCKISNLTDGSCCNNFEKVNGSFPVQVKDYRTRYYVSQASKQPNSNTWEMLVGSYSTPIICLGIGFMSKGGEVVVAYLRETLTKLSSFIDSHQPGCLYFTDQQGTLVAAKGGQTYLEDWNAQQVTWLNAVNSSNVYVRESAKYIERRYGWKTLLDNRTSSTDVNINGNKYYIDTMPFQYDNLRLIGVMILPRITVLGEVDYNRKVTAITLIVMAVGGLGFSCLLISIFVGVKVSQLQLRLRLIEELEAKEKVEADNEAKTTFLSNMSHELRTPVACIIGMLELLQADGLTEDQRSGVEQINSCAVRLLQILNSILDIAKEESGKLVLENEKFNIWKELESLVDMFAVKCERKGLEISLELADDLPEIVRGDQARVLQIFSNLIGNAIKFTSEGHVAIRGWVQEIKPLSVSDMVEDAPVVTSEKDHTSLPKQPGCCPWPCCRGSNKQTSSGKRHIIMTWRDRFRCFVPRIKHRDKSETGKFTDCNCNEKQREDHMEPPLGFSAAKDCQSWLNYKNAGIPHTAVLAFEVEDTGPGIPPELREKIFEDFVQGDASTTRRHGGTGLGLYIARSLARRMGGSIAVKEKAGSGALFSFDIQLNIDGDPAESSMSGNMHEVTTRLMAARSTRSLKNTSMILAMPDSLVRRATLSWMMRNQVEVKLIDNWRDLNELVSGCRGKSTSDPTGSEGGMMDNTMKMANSTQPDANSSGYASPTTVLDTRLEQQEQQVIIIIDLNLVPGTDEFDVEDLKEFVKRLGTGCAQGRVVCEGVTARIPWVETPSSRSMLHVEGSTWKNEIIQQGDAVAITTSQGEITGYKNCVIPISEGGCSIETGGSGMNGNRHDGLAPRGEDAFEFGNDSSEAGVCGAGSDREVDENESSIDVPRVSHREENDVTALPPFASENSDRGMGDSSRQRIRLVWLIPVTAKTELRWKLRQLGEWASSPEQKFPVTSRIMSKPFHPSRMLEVLEMAANTQFPLSNLMAQRTSIPNVASGQGASCHIEGDGALMSTIPNNGSLFVERGTQEGLANFPSSMSSLPPRTRTWSEDLGPVHCPWPITSLGTTNGSAAWDKHTSALQLGCRSPSQRSDVRITIEENVSLSNGWQGVIPLTLFSSPSDRSTECSNASSFPRSRSLSLLRSDIISDTDPIKPRPRGGSVCPQPLDNWSTVIRDLTLNDRALVDCQSLMKDFENDLFNSPQVKVVDLELDQNPYSGQNRASVFSCSPFRKKRSGIHKNGRVEKPKPEFQVDFVVCSRQAGGSDKYKNGMGKSSDLRALTGGEVAIQRRHGLTELHPTEGRAHGSQSEAEDCGQEVKPSCGESPAVYQVEQTVACQGTNSNEIVRTEKRFGTKRMEGPSSSNLRVEAKPSSGESSAGYQVEQTMACQGTNKNELVGTGRRFGTKRMEGLSASNLRVEVPQAVLRETQRGNIVEDHQSVSTNDKQHQIENKNRVTALEVCDGKVTSSSDWSPISPETYSRPGSEQSPGIHSGPGSDLSQGSCLSPETHSIAGVHPSPGSHVREQVDSSCVTKSQEKAEVTPLLEQEKDTVRSCNEGDCKEITSATAGCNTAVSDAARVPVRAQGPDGLTLKVVMQKPNQLGKPLTGIEVLVAEDTALLRKLELTMLQKLGAKAVGVEDGKSAVDAVRERANGGEVRQFDCILMDCQMPVMDGYSATRAIREMERQNPGKATHLPIIALTAHTMTHDKAKCLDAGMDAYLMKPMKVDQLVGVIKEFCSHRIAC